jgi:glycosyltransferase involved in cell wall biosynthesis
MRVALVSTPFVAVPPPGYGGTELVVAALDAALRRAGHDVTVFATGDSSLPDVRAVFRRAVWPPNPYVELLHCRFAAREIARGGFDVVHAHAPAMVAFADDLSAPMIYTIHHEPDPPLARFYEAAPRVHRVAISARQASLLSDPVMDVIHHGLDIDTYPSCGAGGDVAFFLGRLAWCKGPDLAVEAAARAGLRIVIAGKTHGDGAPPRWADEVLEPALRRPHVEWVHEADLAAKRRLFAGARALLAPLRWEEPFGLVLIEALLAGCPVIAFPLGAAPEIVEDGETGFLVRDVGEMAEALRRAAYLDRARIQARARQRFSSDRMAGEYVRTYLAAIAGRPRVRPAAPHRAEGEWTTLAH